MSIVRYGIVIALAAACGITQPNSAKTTGDSASDREKLTGAWRLVSMAGPDGKPITTGLPTGMLIYTRDGHMSVQLMYPASEKGLSNEYVKNGYEASFGSYDVNAAAHTVTHHVQGSITGDRLIGKDLPRVYEFLRERRMRITPANPDEHWWVIWERY